jgi:hypothetical protein
MKIGTGGHSTTPCHLRIPMHISLSNTSLSLSLHLLCTNLLQSSLISGARMSSKLGRREYNIIQIIYKFKAFAFDMHAFTSSFLQQEITQSRSTIHSCKSHQLSGVSYIGVMYLIGHGQFHMAMVQNGEGIVPVITWDWFCTDVHDYLPQSTKDAVHYATTSNVEKWFSLADSHVEIRWYTVYRRIFIEIRSHLSFAIRRDYNIMILSCDKECTNVAFISQKKIGATWRFVKAIVF